MRRLAYCLTPTRLGCKFIALEDEDMTWHAKNLNMLTSLQKHWQR